MAYDLESGVHYVQDVKRVLANEHPCNARQMGEVLARGLEAAHAEIQHLRKAYDHLLIATFEDVLKQANTKVPSTSKDVWHDYEIPILNDPVEGIPQSVRTLEDNNEVIWIRVGKHDRWHDASWRSEYTKEMGYYTVAQILDDYANWVRVMSPDKPQPKHAPLVFFEEDDMPDPMSFPLFRTLDTEKEFRFAWNFETENFDCANYSRDDVDEVFGLPTPDWNDIVEVTRLEEVVE